MAARTNYVIGICGGSCSGKTTFARGILEALGPDACALVFQDSYYIDQSHRFKEDGGDVNFDHPNSIDFTLLAQHLGKLRRDEAIDVPIYDFVTHKRLARTERLPPRPIIVVDGTLLLSQPGIRERLDRSVFLDCSEELRFARRQKRDVEERGRTPAGVAKQFANHVKPMHDLYVQPSKAWASEVVPDPAGFDARLDRCIKLLRSVV